MISVMGCFVNIDNKIRDIFGKYIQDDVLNNNELIVILI